jgi:flagellar motor switch protein FliG
MRYWDGRDLDVGGWREKPDLGTSFETLVFGFVDIGRMRREDLVPVTDWVEDEELALALVGAPASVAEKFYAALPPERTARVKRMLARGGLQGTAAAPDGAAAQSLVISLIKRL